MQLNAVLLCLYNMCMCVSRPQASMPGMMDTVLNLGLNDAVVKGMAQSCGNARAAYDCYRRLLQMFGDVVLGLPREDFEAEIAAIKTEKVRSRHLSDDRCAASSSSSFICAASNNAHEITNAMEILAARQDIWIFNSTTTIFGQLRQYLLSNDATREPHLACLLCLCQCCFLWWFRGPSMTWSLKPWRCSACARSSSWSTISILKGTPPRRCPPTPGSSWRWQLTQCSGKRPQILSDLTIIKTQR